MKPGPPAAIWVMSACGETRNRSAIVAANSPLRSGAEYLEFPQRVAVAGAPGGAVQADVPPGSTERDHLDAACPCGCGVDRRPVHCVVGCLDLERLAVGRFPVQGDLADRVRRTEIEDQPVRVGQGVLPAT